MNNSCVLYEISWEVCNKVGGIHTVINSKFRQANKNFENYYLIGPYLNGSNYEFIEAENISPEFIGSYEYLKSIGIILHFGRSSLLENSKVILVEYLGYAHNINTIKTNLWENYKIDSLNSNWYDFDEAILWSYCVGIAIESLEYNFNRKVLVHAHEWMSGGAIFSIKEFEKIKFKTIFTTHATMLGRTLSGNGVNLYENLKNITDPQGEAQKYGVLTKFQTEKSLALYSDSFTTVSDTTAEEAKFFFGKQVDGVLINGIDNNICPSFDAVLENFIKSRTKIDSFLEKNFPNHDFDKYKLFYTSGRNEVRNKGVDIYIKALSKLNNRLKDENSEIKVVNFILLMSGEFDVLQGNNMLTHNIDNHYILDLLKENNLNNLDEDKILNIFVPVMLNGKDGVINIEYYDFIAGCDLGVFPSLYEPWGYTPLESICFGVPTITSNCAGFGQSVYLTCGDSSSSVRVLPREHIDEQKSIDILENYLSLELHSSQFATLFQKEVAKLLSEKYDWKVLYINYINQYANLLE